MNYLFLNNGFFFKYVKLENVNFKLYNSRSKDDLEFFIDEIKEKSISLRIKYLIYDKETSKSLSNGIKIKRLKEVIKNVNVKLNELSQINYSYLDFDFKNGFINKESKIIISLVDENCINLEKINEFGLEYVGGVIGNIKNGFGELKSRNYKYIGEFKNNQKEGLGSLITKDEFYIGEFKQDKKNGHFRVYYSDNSIYIGDFINDKACGRGLFIYNDGSYEIAKYLDDNLLVDESKKRRLYVKYKTTRGLIDDISFNLEEGFITINDFLAIKVKSISDEYALISLVYMVKDELLNDKVIEKELKINLNKYLDETYNEIDDGKNNDCYISILYPSNNLEDDEIYYRYYFSDMSYFIGETINNKPKYGKRIFRNGDYYIGEFIDDEFSGLGEYHYSNGDILIGSFKKGEPSSKMKYISSDGLITYRKYLSFIYGLNDGALMYKEEEDINKL